MLKIQHQALWPLVRSYKMEIIKDNFGDEYVIIDRGNGEFTSMLKSTYDEQQAANEPSNQL